MGTRSNTALAILAGLAVGLLPATLPGAAPAAEVPPRGRISANAIAATSGFPGLTLLVFFSDTQTVGVSSFFFHLPGDQALAEREGDPDLALDREGSMIRLLARAYAHPGGRGWFRQGALFRIRSRRGPRSGVMVGASLAAGYAWALPWGPALDLGMELGMGEGTGMDGETGGGGFLGPMLEVGYAF